MSELLIIVLWVIIIALPGGMFLMPVFFWKNKKLFNSSNNSTYNNDLFIWDHLQVQSLQINNYEQAEGCQEAAADLSFANDESD